VVSSEITNGAEDEFAHPGGRCDDRPERESTTASTDSDVASDTVKCAEAAGKCLG
jgi:hypothetical protein